MELERLIMIYATEPFESKEAERSMRIIKAAVDTLMKLTKDETSQKQDTNIKIILDE